MRAAFISGLTEAARRDDSIFLLTADLGYGVLEDFERQFPERFRNVGVSEQNMFAVATGLALDGWRPFCYTIAPFAYLRALEFLRDGAIYHQLPVTVVAVGAGVDYAEDGFTHFAVEDLAIFLPQSNCRIIAPASNEAAHDFGSNSQLFRGLTYLRLSRNGPETFAEKPDEKASTVILTVGRVSSVGMKAWTSLREVGIRVSLVALEELSIGSLRELALRLVQKNVTKILVVEEHLARGGVATHLSDLLGEMGFTGSLVRWALNEGVLYGIGSAEYLWDQYAPSDAEIVRALQAPETR